MTLKFNGFKDDCGVIGSLQRGNLGDDPKRLVNHWYQPSSVLVKRNVPDTAKKSPWRKSVPATVRRRRWRSGTSIAWTRTRTLVWPPTRWVAPRPRCVSMVTAFISSLAFDPFFSESDGEGAPKWLDRTFPISCFRFSSRMAISSIANGFSIMWSLLWARVIKEMFEIRDLLSASQVIQLCEGRTESKKVLRIWLGRCRSQAI